MKSKLDILLEKLKEHKSKLAPTTRKAEEAYHDYGNDLRKQIENYKSDKTNKDGK